MPGIEGIVFTLHAFSASKKAELTKIINDYGGEVAYVGKNVFTL